jgi:hypothetical protein
MAGHLVPMWDHAANLMIAYPYGGLCYGIMGVACVYLWKIGSPHKRGKNLGRRHSDKRRAAVAR